ncbi:MAG: hypothetical protein E6772_00435 [Dysgonomonas sp.]|nr:hypothetical protein [Dysgonomonas sp.]
MTTERVIIEISKAFNEAIDYLTESYQGSSLTDIFFVIDRESAELSIYDDEENLLSQRIIDAWIDAEDKQIFSQLREVVNIFDNENKFDKLDVYKPFSINISDENFIVQEELLTIEDDSVIKLDNNFLDRMDKEFDEFLDKLLKE